MDAIWAWLGRDWAQIGGWTLFLGQSTFIVVSVLRDKLMWHTRLEKAEARHALQLEKEEKRTAHAQAASETNAAALTTAMEQNSKLIEATSFYDYVMRELLPPKVGATSKLPKKDDPEGAGGT
jgi:hypothetical protein